MDSIAFENLTNQKISVFYGGKDPVAKHEVSIIRVLNGIKTGKWKDEIEWLQQETDKIEREKIKLKFPALTFSGTFDYRKASEIKAYTHIIVIDLDKKDLEIPYEKAFSYITSCPFVFTAFRSPSGGIKALAYSRCKIEKHRDLLFPCLEDYLIRIYGLKMDRSGKDVSRLCFVSYDPNIYISAEGKRPFSPKEDSPELYKMLTSNFVEVTSVDYDKYENSTSTQHVFEMSRKWAEKTTGGFKKGSRNSYIYYLSCILNRAGMYESTARDIIMQRYKSLGLDEIKAAVKSAYGNHKNEFGIRPILQYKKTDQKPIV